MDLNSIDAYQWALEYLSRGLTIEVYEKSKGVKGPRSKRSRIEGIFELEGYAFTPSTCLGIFPDSLHVGIDLDSPETMALAPYFLPRTEMISGRPGREDSHWWYQLEEADRDVKGTKFLDPSALSTEKSTLCEFIHATGKKTGTMVISPPSPYDDLIPSKNRASWSVFKDMAVVKADQLHIRCGILGAASILARCWVDGQRNELTIALAGALLREKWTPQEIADFLRPIALFCHDDEIDNRLLQPQVTASRGNSGQSTYGWPTVASIIGTARATRIQDWLSFKSKKAKASGNSGSVSCAPPNIARVVYDENQNNFRYVHDIRSWASYKDGIWVIDHSAELDLQSVILDTRAKMAAQNRSTTGPIKWKDVTDTVNMLKTTQGLRATVDNFDQNAFLLNGPDGTHDLERGVLAPWDPVHGISRRMPTPYDIQATCPTWEKQMELTWPDREIREYVQRAFGYSLQGTQSERCFFLLHGEGRNGKSLALRVVEMVLGTTGRGYAQQVNATAFSRNTFSEINSGLSKLRGIRLASVGEFPNKNMNSELIKSITGGESNTSRQLYERTAEFPFQAKLWFSSNFKTGPTDANDLAFWDRMCGIECKTQFPNPDEEGYIPEVVLMDIFRSEASGILNWLLEGYRMWRENGLQIPSSLKRAREEYKAELDLLEQFLQEDNVYVHPMAKTSPDDVPWTPLTEIWEKFDNWAGRIGDDRRHRNQCKNRMELRRAFEQKGFHVGGILDPETNHRSQLKVYGVDVSNMSIIA